MKDLTPQQAKVLNFIKEHGREHQCPPTFMEISCEMGWSSANAATEMVTALERKGYVKVMKGRSRGIFVMGGIAA